MIVTDLGSSASHPLYNFGNLPVVPAFGAKRRVAGWTGTASAVEHKYVDYRVVCDASWTAPTTPPPSMHEILPQKPLELERAPKRSSRTYIDDKKPVKDRLFQFAEESAVN